MVLAVVGVGVIVVVTAVVDTVPAEVVVETPGIGLSPQSTSYA